MNSTNTVFTAFLASATIHALVGSAFYFPSQTQEAVPNDSIRISYIVHEETPKPAPTARPVEMPAPPAIPKKTYAPPRPARRGIKPETLRPVSRPVPTRFVEPDLTEENVQNPPTLEKMTAMASNTAPKSGAELLTDPEKGKIFVDYFGKVKGRIHQRLLANYDRQSGGRGSVSLAFVIGPNGRLERVSVIQKESDADEWLKNLAVGCLREAAPFGGFPKELGSERISFTLTIYFDEL